MLKNILILVVVVFAVFYPCLHAQFINLDDDGHIFNNTYIPLTSLSFALEKHFFGFNPIVFHLDNLLIYVLVVVLVMLLANRLGLSQEASFLAALLFAVHPMKVESVAWVTERKDVLYALFYLLALHQYWSYLKTRSLKSYVAVFLCGFFSILAKPMAVSLPLILFLLDWYEGRRFGKQVFLEKIPIFIYIIGIAWITYALNMHNPRTQMDQGILIWIWSLSFYVWHFLFPFFVCPYYGLPHPIIITHWPYASSLLTVLGLILLLVRFYKNKLFVFAVFYFICSIFFLLHFDKNGFGVVSDRFMFLPGLGICLWLGSWFDGRIKSRWGKIIFLIFVALLGVRAHLQCRVWHDSVSFWNEVIRQNPDFYRAYVDRGAAYYQQNQVELALLDYNKAIALKPDAPKAYNNRAVIFDLYKQEDRAIDDLTKAISLDPLAPLPYLNRSVLEDNQKQYPRALRDALEASRLGGIVSASYLKRLASEIRDKN